MSNWSGGRLTAAGRALQAKVEAGAALRLTKMKVGDGNEGIKSVDDLTNLKSPKLDVPISSTTTQNEMCKVVGLISSSNVTTGFYARELGLFATDPDKGEILYMIAIDPAPDFVPPSTTAVICTAEYSMNISVSNVDSITVNIDPDGLASVDMMNKSACLVQRSSNYSVGNVLYDTQLSPGLYLYCTKAGKTKAGTLDLSKASKGSTVTDGTATWQVRAVTTCFDKDADGDIIPVD